MKNKTIEKFQKIENEVKKIISLLTSVKDENEALKNQLKELEKFKSSAAKNINKEQKMVFKYESLENNYQKLLQEKGQLREKVGQMLKKLEAIELY